MNAAFRAGLRPRRAFLLVLAAALLVELAWALSVPAFRGIDEFDHVYKAEAVAHGMLTDVGPAPRGRGHLVAVPADVVAAAAARCRSYAYTKPDNCRPVQHLDDGLVLVACAAAKYNPVYYAITGTLVRPFHGAAVVFAMRAITGLFTALLLAAAAAVTATWARTAWPFLSLLVAATPVLTYSGAMASPNGVGYAAGCLVWLSLVGLLDAPRRVHVVGATVGAVVVLVTHSTGFVWLGLIAAAMLVLRPTSHWRALAVAHRREVTVSLALALPVLLATMAWIVVNKTNAPGMDNTGNGPMPWGRVPSQLVVWAAQTIAAFPLRNDPAPQSVYGLWLVGFGTLVVLGLRRAGRRTLLTLALLLAAWMVIPVVVSLISYDTDGFAWQGRYTLVLATGFPVLAGRCLERSATRTFPWLAGLTVALCAVAQGIGVWSVTHREAARPLAPDFADLTPAAPWLLGALVVLGVGVTAVLPRAARGPESSTGDGNPALEDTLRGT